MNRGIWLAITLLVAVGANAAETKPEEVAPGKPAKASSKPSKSTKAPEATKTAPQKKQYSKSSTQADPVKVRAAQRAKFVYMFAVESCSRPERCDPTLRESAESQFMQACLDCSTQELCEAARAEIQDGSAKSAQNPCIPP